MRTNDPFARLPEAAVFTVTSATVLDGGAWPAPQWASAVPGGGDVSPQLSWSGAPPATKSYAVTMYDPDAPTGSGLWHWAVADIPATVTPAVLGFTMAGHVLARAVLVATAETPADEASA